MKKLVAMMIAAFAISAHAETYDYAKVVSVKPHMVARPEINVVCADAPTWDSPRFRVPGETCKAHYEIKPDGYEVRRGFEIQYEYRGVRYSTIGGWIPASDKIRVVVDQAGRVRPDL